MIILGIESSCDETGVAVLLKNKDRIQILSNIVASSQQIHIKYGGIVPEQAAREQIKSIIPVVEEALLQAFPNQQPETTYQQLDAIAITQGPGLIGSLLVGVETAKTLALLWNKPIIPVNHLIAHFYANWIQTDVRGDSERGAPTDDRSEARTHDGAASWQDPEHLINIPSFPVLGLLVSGGHTDLILMKNHDEYEYLGGTRDDAAGECFDKCARLLNLPYPGGPNLSKLALSGDSSKFKLPIPMKGSKNLDFSFSGLKTAVLNTVQNSKFEANQDADLASAVENTIILSIVDKVKRAVQMYDIEEVMIAGGVAANKKLREILEKALTGKRLYIPPVNLCTDNAAMVAARAFFEKDLSDPLKIQANPNLTLVK